MTRYSYTLSNGQHGNMLAPSMRELRTMLETNRVYIVTASGASRKRK